MKKFFIKLLIFSIIIFSIIGVINNKYINTNHYRYQNSSYKFYNVPDKIQIGNLGTSHGYYGLNYEDTGLTGFNFALPAQRMLYDLRLFENYIDHFEEGSSLILPVSYISLYIGYDNDNFDEFNKVYYKLLGPKDIIKFNLDDYTKYKLLPILTAESNIKYIFEEDYEEPPKDYFNYTIERDKMILDGEKTSKRHLEFIEEGLDNETEFIGYLEDIIQLAKLHDIKPVLVSPPYTKYYDSHFPVEFKDNFNLIMENLADKYAIDYFNYSQDDRFYDRPEYFFDASHLNYQGGKHFTNILLEDMGGKRLND